MRLFLSSQDLGDYPDRARELAGKNNKALFFKNAQDDLPDVERNFSNPEKKKMFKDAGFEFEMIDLRDYFGKHDQLFKKLKTAGSVWSSGGNTFILRRAMKASGFDRIIVQMLKDDQILYGGWSAGACVAAKSLDGIQFGDRPQPNIVPENYPIKEPIWEGLGLIDFMIIPHTDMEWFKEDAKKCENYLMKIGQSYKKLKDGQVIIMDGKEMEILV